MRKEFLGVEEGDLIGGVFRRGVFLVVGIWRDEKDRRTKRDERRREEIANVLVGMMNITATAAAVAGVV